MDTWDPGEDGGETGWWRGKCSQEGSQCAVNQQISWWVTRQWASSSPLWDLINSFYWCNGLDVRGLDLKGFPSSCRVFVLTETLRCQDVFLTPLSVQLCLPGLRAGHCISAAQHFLFLLLADPSLQRSTAPPQRLQASVRPLVTPGSRANKMLQGAISNMLLQKSLNALFSVLD